jgi:hypothetical protein
MSLQRVISLGGLALGLTVLLLLGCRSGPKGGSEPIGSPQDPAAPQDTVRINIMKTAGTKWIKVNNLGIGLCKHPGRCPDSLTFELENNPPIGENDEIRIRTAGGDGHCIEPSPEPDGYALTRADPTQKIHFLATCDEKTKAVWMYSIACVDPSGGDCGGILPADPGVIIEGGPAGRAH